MGNKIYIKLLDDSMKEPKETPAEKSRVLIFPVMEDISVSYKTEFGRAAGEIPVVNKMINLARLATNLSGKTSSNTESVKSLVDAPTWERTDPPELSVKLIFYTEKDPKKDVFEKMNKIIELGILTIEGSGASAVFKTPGISMQTASAVLNQQKKGNTDSAKIKGKLISVEIPGVIYLKLAYISSVSPIYSKQITKSGYPLWGTLDVTISGLFPATTQIFTDVQTQIDSRKNSSIPGA